MQLQRAGQRAVGVGKGQRGERHAKGTGRRPPGWGLGAGGRAGVGDGGPAVCSRPRCRHASSDGVRSSGYCTGPTAPPVPDPLRRRGARAAAARAAVAAAICARPPPPTRPPPTARHASAPAPPLRRGAPRDASGRKHASRRAGSTLTHRRNQTAGGAGAASVVATCEPGGQSARGVAAWRGGTAARQSRGHVSPAATREGRQPPTASRPTIQPRERRPPPATRQPDLLPTRLLLPTIHG